jgi:hypothetical protein
MAKICFIVSENQFDRSFLKTGVLNHVANSHQLDLIKCSSLKIDSDRTKIFDSIYNIDFRNYPNTKNYRLFFSTLRWRHRYKSKTFIFRETREYIVTVSIKLKSRIFNIRKKTNEDTDANNYKISSKHKTYLNTSIVMNILNKLKKAYKSLFYLAKYRLLSIEPFYSFAPKILGIGKIQCHELHNLIFENNYDVVLYPSSAFEFQIFDIIKSCSMSGAKSFFIIDNWDNLSSKILFWERPDFIATWGKQTTNHAIEIQGFSKEQVFEIGSARYSNYYIAKKGDLELNLPANYVLFFGTNLYFNEILALEQINKEILDNPNIYNDLEVIYRPHPYSENTGRFQNCNLVKVSLDPQIKNMLGFNYDQSESDALNRLSLDFYPRLISKSKFIVGGLTTMLLEASLFDKNYLALVYPENNNITSPDLLFKSYTHFEGIENLPNLSFCSDFFSIGSNFRRVFEAQSKTYDKKSLNYFVHTDVGNYSLKLSKAIDVILESIK